MEILLTRHGQTEWNVLKKVQGRTDIELNETGIQQAKDTARKLQDENIDLIISSPLKRAAKTANIIGETRNIPVIFDERIVERGFGEFEGVRPKENEFADLWNYDLNLQEHGVESIQSFFGRVYEFLDDIKEKYNGKKILLVTHGGTSKPVNCYFNGIENGLKFHLDNLS